MSVRILLADDHMIIRQGLKSLVESKPDMEVVGEAENGREAVRLFKDLRPDVTVMDVAMPDLNGIDATCKILEIDKQAKVVALSMHDDTEYVLRMLDSGASAYLLKDCAFEELESAVRSVMRGEVYLSPRVAAMVVEGYVHGTGRNKSSSLKELTPREREVLQLLSEGKSSKEIAALLDVSGKTIDTHRRNIMEKLGLFSVAELTKFAVREGLTSLND